VKHNLLNLPENNSNVCILAGYEEMEVFTVRCASSKPGHSDCG
jgi:hypothetical protein